MNRFIFLKFFAYSRLILMSFIELEPVSFPIFSKHIYCGIKGYSVSAPGYVVGKLGASFQVSQPEAMQISFISYCYLFHPYLSCHLAIYI